MANILIPGTRFTIDNIYIQDPAFNGKDIELLRELGYKVLFDNAAHLHVSDTTFIYSAYCPWAELFPLLTHSSPSLLISANLFEFYEGGDRMKDRKRKYHLQHPVLRNFYEKRASFDLFIPKSDEWFYALRSHKVYWKAKRLEDIDVDVEAFYDNHEEIKLEDLRESDDGLNGKGDA